MPYKQKPKGLIVKMLTYGNSASPGLPTPAPALSHSPLDCSWDLLHLYRSAVAWRMLPAQKQ